MQPQHVNVNVNLRKLLSAHKSHISETSLFTGAWWGLPPRAIGSRAERFIGRFIGRLRYLPKDAPTAAEIENEADTRLFRSVFCDGTFSRETVRTYKNPGDQTIFSTKNIPGDSLIFIW